MSRISEISNKNKRISPTLIADKIISPNIISLENITSSQSTQIDQLIDLYSKKNLRSYDQTTKQNVTISFNETNKHYRFEIPKNQENSVFMYQVWTKNNYNLNSNRIYKYVSLRNWIEMFKNAKNFNPTTLIEINGTFYPTVMTESVIENDFCVFYFQVKEINYQGISAPSIPLGSYTNVRFDIDSINIQDLKFYKQLDLTMSIPVYTIFNGIKIDVTSCDNTNNLLWKVNQFTTNTPIDISTINVNSNYQMVSQPFLLYYYDDNNSLQIVDIKNNADQISQIRSIQNLPPFYMANQLLYIDSSNNNDIKTIPTLITNGSGGTGYAIDSNGNYTGSDSSGPIGNSYYSNLFDLNSGIVLCNVYLYKDSNGNIKLFDSRNNPQLSSPIAGASGGTFKFWQSLDPYHKNGWNFISIYSTPSTYPNLHIIGSGPTYTDIYNELVSGYGNQIDITNLNQQVNVTMSVDESYAGPH